MNIRKVSHLVALLIARLSENRQKAALHNREFLAYWSARSNF